jgi:crotonobetainyl-CoA:carnitine CoA-transferase CaiB-like acyl-CoA transferase
MGAVGVAAADLWYLRTGRPQTVELDMSHAVAAMRSGRYLRRDNPGEAAPYWADISGHYRTRDGRWIQLHCNFNHHRDAALGVLGCENSKEAVTAAVAGWDAEALETAMAAAETCAGMVRTHAEWDASEQGRAVAALPPLEVIRIADSPPEPLPSGGRPLAGIRSLDLTRVIAGPVGSRTLAEHGADVMRITAEHLQGFPDGLDIDTGHGKLQAQLDLRSDSGVETLRNLVREGDIFLQSYRPGTLARRGFSPQGLAQVRPGIVYVTLCAYSHVGPWSMRRGFDSLLQSVTGYVDEETTGERPGGLPAAAMDYVGGYMLALGALVALARRTREGGSYLVRTSLAQAAQWINGLGRLPGGDGRERGRPDDEAAARFVVRAETPFGGMSLLGPVVRMSETPPYWARPVVPAGYNEPVWPPREA